MTNGKTIIRRLHTGVPGLDEVLGGGLPEFSFNLLAGPPGAGKTTLAHQMMFALATPQQPAIYFTVLGEPPLKMLRYQQQFEFFDDARINSAIHFINLAEEAASGDLDGVLRRIAHEVQAHAPAFVFVDSFRSVLLAGGGKDNVFLSLQQFVQQLGVLMTSWQATSFLLGEYFSEDDPSPIFTVADGLIWLRQAEQGNSIVRKMEIRKMRGQPSLSGLHTFRIDDTGLRVFAPPPIISATSNDLGRKIEGRLSTGIATLDKMMDGGLPAGYSLLVAGPSGSGKSILAGQFLAAGAARGEVGIIAAFEQRPNHSRGPALSKLIDDGQVHVIDTQSATLSVDEVSTLLIAAIDRLKATRVVLDSLSGFELALAPTFRAGFRESLARMMSALGTTGATVLLTSELEDRYDELRFSPYGTAFLTDAIIVQRYIEVDSRLQRVMAVVKLRASNHSSELRLFHIDTDGIHVDHMLADYEGLLGGRPTRRRPLRTQPNAQDD
jgi:circadian clock protein KaiC